jgi:hypothetical protein
MTAIEYMYLQLWKCHDFSCPSIILDRAKEMERNQIIRACNHCKENSFQLLQ